MKKILDLLKDLFIVRWIAYISKRIFLPGFEGMPLYDVAGFFWHGITKGALSMRASAVSFSFFLALFPMVIFMFTLIPYIPIDNFQDELLMLLKSIMPTNAYDAIEDTILDIVTNQRGGLLSVGFISALYFSTNGFDALITAFNSSYHAIETRTGFQIRLVSILLVLIFTMLITTAIILLIGSELLLDKAIRAEDFVYYMIMVGRWIILFCLCYFLVSFIYFLGPSRKSKWKFTSAGSMLATILIILTSWGFTYYVNNFGNYNKIYGSIGTLIVVLLWIYFNSMVLIVGFELNVSIYQAKTRKK